MVKTISESRIKIWVIAFVFVVGMAFCFVRTPVHAAPLFVAAKTQPAPKTVLTVVPTTVPAVDIKNVGPFDIFISLIVPIVVSAIVSIFGLVYRQRELDIARAEMTQKIFETLQRTDGNGHGREYQVQAGLFTISTLGNPKFAIQLTELLSAQEAGAIYALERFASNSDPKISKLARVARENIMDKPHIWKSEKLDVLNKAKAYKMIDDVITGHRQYSHREIADIFSAACKNDMPHAGDDLGLCLDMYRLSTIYKLLNLYHSIPDGVTPFFFQRVIYFGYRFLYRWPEKLIREEFKRMIPLFQEIVRVNQSSEHLHRDYAHLAYVYKDSSRNPRWDDAYLNITNAMDALKTAKLSPEKNKSFLVIYTFNRFLYAVNRDKNKQDAHIRHLLDEYGSTGYEYIEEFLGTHPVLKPGLEKECLGQVHWIWSKVGKQEINLKGMLNLKLGLSRLAVAVFSRGHAHFALKGAGEVSAF